MNGCFEPCVIDADLSEPIVTYGDGLHIDGPIAYAVFMDLPVEEKNQIPSIESNWALDFDLPLERWTSQCELPQTTDPRLTVDGHLVPVDGGDGFIGRVWGWNSSAAVAVGVSEESRHELRKRPPIEDYVKYTESVRVETAMGPNKAKDLCFPTVIVRRIRWYAVGDIERIQWLLTRYVHSVGKLSRHGQGRISQWRVRPSRDGDLSMTGTDGRPMRRLPAMMFPERPVQMGTIRAPYFHRSRWAVTVAPEAWDYEDI